MTIGGGLIGDSGVVSSGTGQTLAQLKTKIAEDLHRTDLTTQIADAINAAIRYYNRNEWWFIESTTIFNTEAYQPYYDVPTGFETVDSMMITVSGSKTPIRPWTYEQMDEEDMGNTYGIPSRWAVYNNQFRLYPVPNAVYLITLSQEVDLLAPANDSDSNAWTGAAFDLIRFRAGWDVAKHKMHNADLANALKASEVDEYYSLLKEHTRMVSSGRLQKSWW